MLSDIHNTKSGKVALLGGGESINDLDLRRIEHDMPIIGMNSSWKVMQTDWWCMIDEDQWRVAPGVDAKIKFYSEINPPPHPLVSLDVSRHRVANPTFGIPWSGFTNAPANDMYGFRGFDLDRIGSCAAFVGWMALEIACWAGYDEVFLLGYDCIGGHFYDTKKSKLDMDWNYWKELFDKAVPVIKSHGVHVFNCSPNSDLEAFQKVSCYDI